MNDSIRVRPPAVAGSFYPGDARKLRRDIQSYLATAAETEITRGRPLILIEPHAGYKYSGQIAAYGYRLIENLDIRTVAVISPSHMDRFPFISVFDGDAYETPLGTIDVDKRAAGALATGHADIRLSGRGHMPPDSERPEHALEVQLPFLQAMLEDFRIIPIVMGNQSWDLCTVLGEALSPYLTRRDFLVVVSSDLSHFHGYDDAQQLDDTFCALLESMNTEQLYDSIGKRECEACGAGPVIASLIAGKHAGASRCQVLHAANSGDVTGDHTSVVGYAAAAVFADDRASDVPAPGDTALSDDERTYLLDLARASVTLAVGCPGGLPEPVDSPRLNEPRGAFVTLKIRGRLRGCIGTIEPLKPLRKMVGEMARAAALSDPRFSPLTEDDLPELDIEISAMSPLREIQSATDIVVGAHGIIIEKGHKRGLLLPQVAVEHGWDAESFLGYTCEKAGLGKDAWRDGDTAIYIFSADVFGE
jgi:AmmeMemoRadiSam system protein B/AmmeMemoRadiSam system protein A